MRSTRCLCLLMRDGRFRLDCVHKGFSARRVAVSGCHSSCFCTPELSLQQSVLRMTWLAGRTHVIHRQDCVLDDLPLAVC